MKELRLWVKLYALAYSMTWEVEAMLMFVL
jgi:hypothetical protein